MDLSRPTDRVQSGMEGPYLSLPVSSQRCPLARARDAYHASGEPFGFLRNRPAISTPKINPPRPEAHAIVGFARLAFSFLQSLDTLS